MIDLNIHSVAQESNPIVPPQPPSHCDRVRRLGLTRAERFNRELARIGLEVAR